MSAESEAPEALLSVSNVGDSIRSIVSDLGDHAGVESVYGEPIEVAGKTIVPVARVAYGFGGGFGRGGDEDDEEGAEEAGSTGQGAGGGGGVSARPVGVVEIDAGETRLLRFGDRRRAGIAMLAGLALGLLLGRRRYRST